MGKLHDALRKAENERQRTAAKTPVRVARPAPVSAVADAGSEDGPAPDQQGVVAAVQAPVAAGTAQKIVAANFAGALYRGEADAHLIPLCEPHSPIAEQYRSFRTNLLATAQVHGLKVFVLTSSVPGEGKSVSSANLACVLAEDPEKKVVLIDGDLRKPTIHRLLGVDNHRGLSDYLAGGSMLEMALQRSRLPNLWVLPAGHAPANPTELLAGKRMEDLIARLRRDYDWVVIDTPPVVAATDASVLSPRADGTVLVVRMGSTQQDVVRHAVELLRKGRGNVVGTLLTGLSGELQDYHYYPRAADGAR